MENPYPEDIFPPMNLKEASDALEKAGISPDRVFGNWGRHVWNNAHQDTLKDVGELMGNLDLTDRDACSKFMQALQRSELPIHSTKNVAKR